MMQPMRLRHDLVYDAPPQAVFAMLADPAFREAVCTARDVVSAEVSLERTGTGFTLTVDQEQRTDDLPAFARAFAGETTRTVQHEDWADTASGTVRIEAPGKPTTVNGTVTLRAEGSGTREVVELEVKVKVPVVGGKLEKLMSEKILAGLDAEHSVGTAYLRGA
jgi:carbon monoxide dehydrogenase subunit G